MLGAASSLLLAAFSASVIEAAVGADGAVAVGRAPVDYAGPSKDSMTFTLVLPRVSGAATGWAEVSTVGITTAHRSSPVTALRHGQVESYSVTPLSGMARTVQVLER